MKIAIVHGHLGRFTTAERRDPAERRPSPNRALPLRTPPTPPGDGPRESTGGPPAPAGAPARPRPPEGRSLIATERARELARELGRQGHEVNVYSRRDDPDAPRRTRLGPGATVEHVTAGPTRPLTQEELLPHMAEFGQYLAARWEKNPPEVVHAHFWLSGLAALAGARPLGIPVVQTYETLGLARRRHRSAEKVEPAPRIRLETAIGRTADAVIATCSDQESELLTMGVPRHRIGVVPCGVDVTRFTPEGPAYPRGKAPRLLVLSRLTEPKGVDVAIQALAWVPHAELVIAGGPPYEEIDRDPRMRGLRRLASIVGVADRVTFLGRVPRRKVPQLLRSADLVLTLPRYEPFGMVPLEAMACGVPVVATEVGGHRDSLIDNVTGVHVPAGRPAELAWRVRDLLSHPTHLHAMGIAGADRARSRYGWDRVARETATVYGKVTDARVIGGPAAR